VSPSRSRARRLDEINRALPERVSELAGLFLARSDPPVSWTDARVMQRLADGPLRISELAAGEQITQPGITLLVNRMVQRGWARRRPDPSDGRAVLVELTDGGRAELDTLGEGYAALLSEHMRGLSDREIDSLADAVRILEDLIASLRLTLPQADAR
jgi:DNA-binding MarR family transcriptional regulator